MVLDSFRQAADRLLNPLAKRLSRVSPNVLSWIALLFAALAAISFYAPRFVPLVLGAVFLFLNAVFDALDGKVAKLTGKASARGDFLDHLLDRYADVLMLGGIALGPYCPTWLGLLAIVGVLLTSYVGTQAQAVGIGRDYRGILGRADRLVILLAAALLQASFDPFAMQSIGAGAAQFTVLGWTMLLFAVLGNATAIQRAMSAWRRLR